MNFAEGMVIGMNQRMLRFMKEYATCKHLEHQIADFSFYEGFDATEKTPHFYCANCESRWLRGVHYTPNEWDRYVNDMGEENE